MATQPQRADIINRIRDNATQFIENVNQYKALAEQLGKQDVAATLVEADFTGNNAGLVPADVLGYMVMMGGLLSGMSEDDQKLAYTLKQA